MSRRFSPWLAGLLLVLMSRLVVMALLPFVDTTEPRYAEITRLMLATGDWITPWFEPGVPFWGKPPLSFWAQAVAGELFGLSEFSLRLPSLVVSIGIVVLIWFYTEQLWGRTMAQWSVLMLSTMLLFYVSAGTVMTDSWLVLGTTLSLVSFGMVTNGQFQRWRWLFFAGLTIGLLAKGPLALVLTGLPIALWFGCQGQQLNKLRMFPWRTGLIGTAVLVLPWYLAAELKTPGFLDYFIVGEHFLRFVDSGWTGDRYGSAHDQPAGMIWIFWLMAIFPWNVIALLALAIYSRQLRGLVALMEREPHTQLVLLCTLTPLLFFTIAGNILWTYALPALPFTAMLLARWFASLPLQHRVIQQVLVALLVTLAPVLLTVASVAANVGLLELKTEKGMVSRYEILQTPGDSPLLYLNEAPFSARFYSRGTAREVTLQELQTMREAGVHPRYFLAVPVEDSQANARDLPASVLEGKNARFQLMSFTDPKFMQRH